VYVLWALSKTTHEITIPIITEGYVSTEKIARICERFLHIITEPVKHLEFKLVSVNILFSNKLSYLCNDMVVMSSDGSEGVSFQPLVAEVSEFAIDLFLILNRYVSGFFVRAFNNAQACILVSLNIGV